MQELEATPTTMPAAALEAFIALERDRSRGGNPHPPMMANRYVSGSQTVKKTCVDLAALIAGTKTDDSDEHWGENGNALADINLVNVPWGENEASVPITGTKDEAGGDWNFIIHADGLALTNAAGFVLRPDDRQPRGLNVFNIHAEPWWLGAYEHKAPLHPYDDDSFDLARRQVLASMGAILACHEAGRTMLPPAFYIKKSDPRHRNFPLPEQLLAGAISVVCAPYTAERERRPEIVTAQQARQELDRCLAKARAAIWTATGKDPDAAARWDREHATEFLYRQTEKTPATKDEAHAEVARLCAAMRIAKAPEDPGKAAREKAKDRVKALITKHGLPLEVTFDTGVSYAVNAKGALTVKGEPADPDAGSVALIELGYRGA